MDEKKIGHVTVRLVQGDLTATKADAIVNSANTDWKMGSGVAFSIKRKGGLSIEQEAVQNGVRPVGTCVVTKAGTLPSRFVIHAAVAEEGGKATEESLRTAVANVFEEGEKMHAEALAFPALGTGVGSFPIGDCARVLLAGVKAHLEKTPKTTLKEVQIVLLYESAFKSFQEALAAA